MAQRIVSITTITPTATADTTNLVDATYPFLLQGGSATQACSISNIYMGGQAASTSSPTFMILSRDSTVAVTNSNGTGQTDAAVPASTAALAAPALTGNTNTTKPQRSSTLHLLNLSFNAFGGIVKYDLPPGSPGQTLSTIGNTASLGEVSLSAFTGGTPGALGAHMIYEPT